MKKLWLMWILVLALSGCAAQETFEIVEDELAEPAMAQPREFSVRLPEDALVPVLESGSEQVYLCEDYEILLETREGGDLDGTIRHLSGYGKDQLTVMEIQQEDAIRYEFVWAAAGEQGERMGRGVVLDDGNYHYCLSVLRDANGEMSQILWSDVFASFELA